MQRTGWNRMVSTLGMSHEDWLMYRKRGIGGSDAGAICGMNPYSSPIAVYMDKISPASEKEDNEAMRQGRDLEAYVAERFMEATGKKVRKANSIFFHLDHPYMIANVDRMVIGENAGLECKTVSPYNADLWEGGKIPPHYEVQCHHYMAVTGADAWYIAAVILGRGFLYKRIERDDDLIQSLISIESDFWNIHVEQKIMPYVDGSPAAEQLIREMYPDSSPGTSIPLPDAFSESLKRREEIDELMDKLEQEKAQVEQEIKQYMEDAEEASNRKYRVTWKSCISNRIDSNKLKEELPAVYQAYCKESKSRRFLVKKLEEG